MLEAIAIARSSAASWVDSLKVASQIRSAQNDKGRWLVCHNPNTRVTEPLDDFTDRHLSQYQPVKASIGQYWRTNETSITIDIYYITVYLNYKSHDFAIALKSPVSTQLTFKKRSGVRSAFHQQFIITHLPDERRDEFYDQFFPDRQAGDYVGPTCFNPEDVEEQLARCQQLIAKLRPLIASPE